MIARSREGCQHTESMREWYVLEVLCTTQVFTQAVQTEVRAWVGHGRPPTKTRLVAGEPGPVAVQTLAAG